MSQRYRPEELAASLEALLFWINQGDFSKMPVGAIEQMHRAIKKAQSELDLLRN